MGDLFCLFLKAFLNTSEKILLCRNDDMRFLIIISSKVIQDRQNL